MARLATKHRIREELAHGKFYVQLQPCQNNPCSHGPKNMTSKSSLHATKAFISPAMEGFRFSGRN